MTENLLPCPFCGGEASYRDDGRWEKVYDEGGAIVDVDISSPSVFIVECSCGAQIISDESEGAAIAAWNSRTGNDTNVATNNAVPVVRGYSYEDDKTYSGPGTSNCICSVCGEMQGTWKKGLAQNQKFKFCPKCNRLAEHDPHFDRVLCTNSKCNWRGAKGGTE